MEAARGVKKPHMGRRRLVVLGVGGGMIAVGLVTLADQALVASLIQPFVGSSTSATASGFMPFGDMSFVAYAIGFGILMSGIGIVRSTMRSSLTSYASGGSAMGMGMGGFSPESMQKMMETSMAQMNAATARAPMAAAPAAAAPVVKVKCPKCGSLEEEDAAFCHKCGSAMGGPAPTR